MEKKLIRILDEGMTRLVVVYSDVKCSTVAALTPVSASSALSSVLISTYL